MRGFFLAYPVFGSKVEVDHGYQLYAALSQVCPEVHEAPDLGVFPLRGYYVGNGLLSIVSQTTLRIIAPPEACGYLYRLAGKRLVIGEYPIRLGIPTLRPIKPHSFLRARCVTIKGFVDEDPFLEALGRKVVELEISSGNFHVRRRRTFRVKQRQIVGFDVVVSNLNEYDSVRLQLRGLGGRRKMGCGLFVPVAGGGDE